MATAVNRRRYLSAGEVAQELRVSKASVYRAVESGSLPAIRLVPLGALRIPADPIVEAYLAERLSHFIEQQEEDEAIRGAVEQFVDEATSDDG